MGTRNKQRRAAKARRRDRDRVRRFDAGARRGYERELSASDLARELLQTAVAAQHDDPWLAQVLAVLAELDQRTVDTELEAMLLRAVAWSWDHGWQPAELVRVGRRAGRDIGDVVWAAMAADHGRRSPSTLDPAWLDQVESLELPGSTATGWLAACGIAEGAGRATFLAVAVAAVGTIGRLGPLPTVIPPPGTNGARGRRDPRLSTDDPVLAKVRALLAQAESTSFEAEAEAFTAKAQELMARHAIDRAVLWDNSERGDRPVTIRLAIDDPYADIKALLLQVVAQHSRCQAVRHPPYGLSSVVGFASDCAAAETLYTSLLVQSHAALQYEAAKERPGGRARSRSFRSSFLMAFTSRIDERLREINAWVERDAVGEKGLSLLPVLAARNGAVDDAVRELFGGIVHDVVRGGSDRAGWVRGRMAADQARLNADIDRPRIALER
jgi:hypothetical protein